MTPLIDLQSFERPLADFVSNGMRRFRAEHANVIPAVIALYSSPGNGWVSLCIGTQIPAELNCPDLDFVEFELSEVSTWAETYEAHDRFQIIGADGAEIEADCDTGGDEAFNQPVFNLLRAVMARPDVVATIRSVAPGDIRLGAQMLDSKFVAMWTPVQA